MKPIVREHEGILVVRDDLLPGGTKSRYLPALFEGIDELVYASPAEGGAQYALAHVAQALGKRATIFVAKRKTPHERQFQAKALGAKVMQVRPGYLSVVRARARAYCESVGAGLAPFGMEVPGSFEAIAAAARSTGLEPDEVWCAAGSGVLARGLRKAWPQARLMAVQIGRTLTRPEVGGGHIIVHPLAFGQRPKTTPPFPSDPHYDAKAWHTATARRGPGRVVFWNVTGPASR